VIQRNLLDCLEDKMHHVVGRHPLAQVDRQQQRLIGVGLNEIIHAGILPGWVHKVRQTANWSRPML
jgi:hypothetical protein